VLCGRVAGIRGGKDTPPASPLIPGVLADVQLLIEAAVW